jgi:hypothetical protein
MYSCISIKKNKENNISKDYKINFPGKYYFKNKILKKFIEDYTEQPECLFIKMYELDIDQRQDTLICTLTRCLSFRYPQENNYLGYFKIGDNIILYESPIAEFIDIDIDTSAYSELLKLYKKQMQNHNKIMGGPLVWQLQISILDKKYKIVTDPTKIHDTYFKSYKVLIDTLRPGETLMDYFKRLKEYK